MQNKTSNLRIKELRPIISPSLLCEEYTVSPKATLLIQDTRAAIENIIAGADSRLLVICGPCSIHDVDAALEYADKLKELASQCSEDLLVVMRVYFEKPRTTAGWKGLINDPMLDETFDINLGLKKSRKLLIELADMGIPAGTEFLDSIIPQYIADTISWGAIGARTSESQVHRAMASGLSMPVGFKNGTDGSIQVAIDAVGTAKNTHQFLSINENGSVIIVSTHGNPHCHVILRGSSVGPNYDPKTISVVSETLKANGHNSGIVVDCSHGNSEKDHEKQKLVVRSLAEQIRQGSQSIRGTMLESFLVAGKQRLAPLEQMQYGQSVTDACLNFEETVVLVKELAESVCKRRSVLKNTRAGE